MPAHNGATTHTKTGAGAATMAIRLPVRTKSKAANATNHPGNANPTAKRSVLDRKLKNLTLRKLTLKSPREHAIEALENAVGAETWLFPQTLEALDDETLLILYRVMENCGDSHTFLALILASTDYGAKEFNKREAASLLHTSAIEGQQELERHLWFAPSRVIHGSDTDREAWKDAKLQQLFNYEHNLECAAANYQEDATQGNAMLLAQAEQLRNLLAGHIETFCKKFELEVEQDEMA